MGEIPPHSPAARIDVILFTVLLFDVEEGSREWLREVSIPGVPPEFQLAAVGWEAPRRAAVPGLRWFDILLAGQWATATGHDEAVALTIEAWREGKRSLFEKRVRRCLELWAEKGPHDEGWGRALRIVAGRLGLQLPPEVQTSAPIETKPDDVVVRPEDWKGEQLALG